MNKQEIVKERIDFKKRLIATLCIVDVVLILIITCLFYFIGKTIFMGKTEVELSQYVPSVEKTMLSSLQGELKLALQMAKSPVTQRYCNSPEGVALKNMHDEMDCYASSFLSAGVFYMSDVDRMFYSTGVEPYWIDTSLSENYWYQMTMSMPSNQAYNFNINYNSQMNQLNMWINAVVRSTNTGNSIGLVGTGIPLSVFTDTIYKSKSDDVILYLFNDEWETVGAIDLKLIEDKVDIKKVLPGSIIPQVENYMKKGHKDVPEKIKAGNYLGYMTSIDSLNWKVIAYKVCSVESVLRSFSIAIYIAIIFFVIILSFGVVAVILQKHGMQMSEAELGSNMFESTQNLLIIAQETAATSQDQNAAVKEIVATMEDSNLLSENISNKITDVTQIASQTFNYVQMGGESIKTNLQKLQEIFDANTQTISGIKNLNSKVDTIWEIVSLITDVADQAKIIAFNAELEANAAGESGLNFHIVATEIRRLADSIIKGTMDIKDRITDIQNSSKSLIRLSENGSAKVNEGQASARQLEESFGNIKKGAESTTNSAREITNIIKQQAESSGQILVTLKQIASGVENFSAATETVSMSAQKLKDIAVKLNKEMGNQEENGQS